MNIQEFYVAICKDSDPESLEFKYHDETDYFGKNVSDSSQHYLKAFQRNKHKCSLFPNWNWMAFLFMPIWLLYRRLYAVYILVILSSVLLAHIPQVFMLIALLNICAGIFGDSIYIYFVRQAHGRQQKMNPGNIPFVVLMALHLLVISIIYYLENLIFLNNS
ncbi:MAG: DUF2628 domain-containing protein [Candidatus Paracaedibacteraceae bacterium]|nr:DUF2628 domain-containing protein [Candidatus Paracaedibacteraceae bacterium]